MFVPYLLKNGEPQRAKILRDDSPLNAYNLKFKKLPNSTNCSLENQKNANNTNDNPPFLVKQVATSIDVVAWIFVGSSLISLFSKQDPKVK